MQPRLWPLLNLTYIRTTLDSSQSSQSSRWQDFPLEFSLHSKFKFKNFLECLQEKSTKKELIEAHKSCRYLLAVTFSFFLFLMESFVPMFLRRKREWINQFFYEVVRKRTLTWLLVCLISVASIVDLLKISWKEGWFHGKNFRPMYSPKCIIIKEK